MNPVLWPTIVASFSLSRLSGFCVRDTRKMVSLHIYVRQEHLGFDHLAVPGFLVAYDFIMVILSDNIEACTNEQND